MLELYHGKTVTYGSEKGRAEPVNGPRPARCLRKMALTDRFAIAFNNGG